ncbi:MAG: hypothetical protein DRR16_23040 [Candidatus Parabeggiatoa sp. nov. 3]|nr:MAG: hypothetical protein DRR00_29130 [Gammaproteobacteria bacterium]RKZ63385.1 MAG: hypothetical protein DRQ99_17160 [Gammaproteobacteria bacterium]RKZ80911.1 MAG: hypothetical protein DRR16_23040 [Gammaproteobacteria bacterium]
MHNFLFTAGMVGNKNTLPTLQESGNGGQQKHVTHPTFKMVGFKNTLQNPYAKGLPRFQTDGRITK